MKKILVMTLLVTLVLCGCEKKQVVETNPPVEKALSQVDKELFIIREKMFIAQCNDVYLNPKEYIGKTVQIEGICDVFEDPTTKVSHYAVIRKGPGCCGNDGVAGFEFVFDDQYPKKNSWIEVVGKIETLKDGDYESVMIHADKVTVKKERGAEFVPN